MHPLIVEVEKIDRTPIYLNLYNIPEGVNEADLLQWDCDIKEVMAINKGKTDIAFETKKEAIHFLESGPKVKFLPKKQNYINFLLDN